MADVTLAELADNVWLVDGEAYLDDLLANTLAPSVTIDFVACRDPAEMRALCRGDAQPWAIHPAIVKRIKGISAVPELRFAPWSAMVDEAAITGWRQRHPDAAVTLRQFSPADAPPGLGDLQRLRGQLVAAALARAGLDPERIAQESIASEKADDVGRMELISRSI